MEQAQERVASREPPPEGEKEEDLLLKPFSFPMAFSTPTLKEKPREEQIEDTKALLYNKMYNKHLFEVHYLEVNWWFPYRSGRGGQGGRQGGQQRL